jgi:chromosome segregation ATPase
VEGDEMTKEEIEKIVKILKDRFREFKAGGCKILSKGDACDCSLCLLEFLLTSLTEMEERVKELIEERDGAIEGWKTRETAIRQATGAIGELNKKLDQAEARVRELEEEIGSRLDTTIQLGRLLEAVERHRETDWTIISSQECDNVENVKILHKRDEELYKVWEEIRPK